MEFRKEQIIQLILLPCYHPFRLMIETSNEPYALEYVTSTLIQNEETFTIIDENVTSINSHLNDGNLIILYNMSSFDEGRLRDLNRLLFSKKHVISLSPLKIEEQFLNFFNAIIYLKTPLLPDPVSIYEQAMIKPYFPEYKTAVDNCYIDPKIVIFIEHAISLLRKLEFKCYGKFVFGFLMEDSSNAEFIAKLYAVSRKQQYCLFTDAKQAVLSTCLTSLNIKDVDVDIKQIYETLEGAIGDEL